MNFRNHKNKFLLLSLLSGLLFWLSWPTKPLGFLLHVAFVPLLMIEDELHRQNVKTRGRKFFGYSYLALLIWNISTTWWVYNATAGGAIFAMIANAFLMCIPLMLFYWTKRAAGNLAGYFSFPVYWLAFEYIHLSWDLTWPWLTLGNGFASLHPIIQWYEFTGHLGGSLWVLIGNILIFASVRYGTVNKAAISIFSIWFGIPVLISLAMYFSYQEHGTPTEVVVVQPNVDPYEEKFQGGERFIPYEEQLKRLIRLSEAEITPQTKFVAWPETALPFGYFEHELDDYDMIRELKAFTRKHPQLTLITGLDTYRVYENDATPTARYNENIGYYDAFNAAIKVDSSGKHELYHKAKLVPGVEYVPPMVKAIDLGGVAGSLGRSESRTVFFSPDSIGTAPVICYESIYGEYVTEYIRKGAGFITIITNDGWWGNTLGHRQHLDYARLRAIETRKAIARSANTGVSGFINQKGDVVSRSKYDEPISMRGTVLSNSELTFYAKYGDYLALGAIFFAMLCIILSLYRLFLNKKNLPV